MARLREHDLQVILGPDWARKLESDLEHKEPITPAEKAKARERRATKLSELRFSLFALVAIGCGLLFGSWYNKAGLDIQAMCGVAAVVVGVVSLFIATVKRRRIVKESRLAEASA
jgi:hypothetical protein